MGVGVRGRDNSGGIGCRLLNQIENGPREDFDMSETKKCAHASCSCLVPVAQKFCSQICEDSVGVMSIKCDCKHPACA